MNTKILLPFAAVSVLALAACGGDTPPPAQPDPNAGAEVIVETPASAPEPIAPAPEPVAPAEPVVEDINQAVENVQQEANERFEQIMQETEQAGENLQEMGNNAMQSVNNQLQNAGQTLESQVDGLITGLENLRDQNLTEEQKVQAVAGARAAAENAARLFNRTEAEIRSIGDSTEERARAALGL